MTFGNDNASILGNWNTPLCMHSNHEKNVCPAGEYCLFLRYRYNLTFFSTLNLILDQLILNTTQYLIVIVQKTVLHSKTKTRPITLTFN